MTDKRGPIIHWETESPAEPARMSGKQQQLQQQLHITDYEDSTTTAMPSFRTGHERLGDDDTGCYVAKRQPGAE